MGDECKILSVSNHIPSYLPDGKWNLGWNDEFDGTELDMTKWDYRSYEKWFKIGNKIQIAEFIYISVMMRNDSTNRYLEYL